MLRLFSYHDALEPNSLNDQLSALVISRIIPLLSMASSLQTRIRHKFLLPYGSDNRTFQSQHRYYYPTLKGPLSVVQSGFLDTINGRVEEQNQTQALDDIDPIP